MPAAMYLIANSMVLSSDAVLRLALVAGLFGVLMIAFLYAALRCRRMEALAPPPPPPLQLEFNVREHVVSDGEGCKSIRVTVKNTTGSRTLTGIDVRLKTLEALHKNRLDAPPDWSNLQLPLPPAMAESSATGDAIRLGPGESLSYLVARSVVGDCYLYLPSNNSHALVAPEKVTLAPYLATITATALDTPADAMALELPIAGRGLGTPRARHRSR
jgi:hypothetical protein